MHPSRSFARAALMFSCPALFGCLCLLPSDGQEPARAAPKPPPAVKVRADLTYCTIREVELKLTVARLGGGYWVELRPRVVHLPLQLNVAYPAQGKGPFPAVVIIHGGGWIYGSHREHIELSKRLAAKGYVAVTITYRFTKTHGFPAQVHDVKCAVRWLRAHAAAYKVDERRIGVFGHSAGGHLACMLGTTGGRKELEGTGGFKDQSSAVCCVVGCSALTDLVHAYQNAKDVALGFMTRGAVAKFLGGPPDKVGDRYAEASPITYASKTSVPTLLIYGMDDPLVPIAQSQRLCAKLRQAGAEVEILPVKDAAHDFNGAFARRAEAAMLEFFDRHLKGAGAKR